MTRRLPQRVGSGTSLEEVRTGAIFKGGGDGEESSFAKAGPERRPDFPFEGERGTNQDKDQL